MSRTFTPTAGHLPIGTFDAKITSAIEEISNNGDPVIDVTLTCAEGSHKDRLYFTPKAFWRVTQFWRAIGRPFTEGVEITFEVKSLVGEKCKFRTAEKESSQGKKFIEVAEYIKADADPENSPF